MDQPERARPMTRQDFIKTSAVFGGGLLLSSTGLGRSLRNPARPRKYAIVGTGIRSGMYQRAILGDYATAAELVGLCDVNEGRLKLAQARAMEQSGNMVPLYLADDFDRMIRQSKANVVIVTTVDGVHHEYIVRAMELGCDVITEKPMTIDAEKCQQIIDTQRSTGRVCKVTFNYRYAPPRSQVKDLLMGGVIGDLLSVDFHWMLNTHHGADYFRRWHSQKKHSGGLMVHKATHHFDLVNWWLSATPVSVFATGKREFYTPEMAQRFGLKKAYERCRTCPQRSFCGFELDLEKSPTLKSLYLDNEKYDGYYRDRCVFRPDIDIEDTMNVLVRYDNDVTLCYSLNAFNSWEGYQIVFNGTKGRLEHQIEEQVYIAGLENEHQGLQKGAIHTRIIPLRGPAYDVEPWTGEGGHGGGDVVLLHDLFAVHRQEDKYRRAADHRAGAYSILTGVAANLSISSGKAIRIADLVHGIDYPDYPPMPSRSESLPMPAKT